MFYGFVLVSTAAWIIYLEKYVLYDNQKWFSFFDIWEIIYDIPFGETFLVYYGKRIMW